MNRILLSVPALLPLFGGMGLLWASLFSPWAKKLREPEGGPEKPAISRLLFCYVEGITLLNSLVLLWLILKAGEGESVMLFRLYGELQVMFCLYAEGSQAGDIFRLLPDDLRGNGGDSSFRKLNDAVFVL